MEAVARGRIEYPERDGKPMGETDFHISAILYLRQALDFYFRDTPDVYVAANMFLYYEKGNPSAVVCPDVFVVRGVEKRKRRTFKLWEEKVAPCAVVEVTSLSSRIEDVGTKRGVYDILGVQEYFLFDPLNEYLTPPLCGFRRVGGQYRALRLSRNRSLRSAELGLILQPSESRLRLIDPRTGEALPDLLEAMDRASAERQRAEAESQRAESESQRAEAESQRAESESQRAESESQRAEAESQRAESESQRAESESQRAESESQRAARAEREVARLRARLKALEKKR